MRSTPNDIVQLLAEVQRRRVTPEPYSRRSLYGRSEQLRTTSLLAFIAVVLSVVLCKLTSRLPALER